jgi:ADP-ribose pyrophosphatase
MTQEIQQLESKIVYENRWMTVREDKVLRSSGQTGIYGVVEKSDFAVIAAVENQQIYLVQQYRYPVAGRFWELPQGSWEKSETSPLELAAAELKEETGLIANKMIHVAHIFLAYGYSNQGYDVFFASELKQSNTNLDIEEADLIARSFHLSEVEAMIVNGEIKDATTIAAFGMLRLKGLI